MKLRFTKMHGAGNDFVVIDATREPFALTPAQMRLLGDRRFGVGCDQILVIEPGTDAGADFRYRIFNNTGDEVEHCGNGARCFVRYVADAGLSDKREIQVDTMNRRLLLKLQDDGRVTVNMGAPVFDHAALPFDAGQLQPRHLNGFELWPVEGVELAVLSMGNPHAVQRVDDVETAPVLTLGPRIEQHARFPRRVNAGFMQILARDRIALRVYERDAGETLACGTGACAAVVAGIRLGWLDAAVEVQTRGGLLRIEWAGGENPVLMTGPAVKVFDGEIEAVSSNPAADAVQGITETDIANYLAATPGFFERHAALLATVQLQHPHGARAVSLQERQAEMLRDKIKGLELRIIDMIRNGQDNVAIADRLHRWTLAVMRAAGTPAELPEVLLRELRHQFMIPQASLRLWGVAAAFEKAEYAAAVSADVKSFASSLSQPYCGVNSGFEAARWLGLSESGGTATSLALIPLHQPGVQDDKPFGLLVLGSPDPTRYTAEMGTDFLTRVGEIASAGLAGLLASA